MQGRKSPRAPKQVFFFPSVTVYPHDTLPDIRRQTGILIQFACGNEFPFTTGNAEVVGCEDGYRSIDCHGLMKSHLFEPVWHYAIWVRLACMDFVKTS